MILRRAEFLTTLLGIGLFLGGCPKPKEEPKKSDDDDDDDDRKKKKKKKKKKDSEDKEAKKDDKGSDPKKDDAPKPATPVAAGGPDLAAILGTKADGFPPLVFAKLKENMTAADATKIFPDMEKPSEFGIALQKKNLPPGVANYEFTFLEAKLKFASVVFTKAVSDDAFWAKLVAHLKAKLAPVEMSDLSKNGDKNAMWIGPGFHSITIGPKISLEDLGFEVNYAVI